MTRSLVECSLAAGALWLGLLVSAGAAETNDYPTSARADYVFGCMAVNGQSRESLERCSCSVDVVASIHGRRNPSECARVLARGGELLVAVPAPDDLIELRAHVQGRAVERQRGPAVTTEHVPSLSLVEEFEVRERHVLSTQALRDLLRGTYRAERRSMATRSEALEALEVTLASSVFVFKKA